MGDAFEIPLGFLEGFRLAFVAFAPDILQGVPLTVAAEFVVGEGGTDGVDTLYVADGVVRWVVDIVRVFSHNELHLCLELFERHVGWSKVDKSRDACARFGIVVTLTKCTV